MQRFQPYRREFRPMLQLALPIVLAELGWMAMSVVDVMVVGRLPDSAQAIGAVSVGSVIFYTVGVFGMGLLLGLDTLVSQAFGAGDIDDCHHSLLQGIYLALVASPVLMAFVWLCMVLLERFGIEPGVLREARAYLQAIVWSTLPLLLHYAFRRYLQGMNVVRPVMFALFTANLVNLAANWVLVFGNLGAPALGVAGSGWATCLSRGYMAVFLGLYVVYHDRRYRTGLFRIAARVDPGRIRALLRLGLPAAGQISIEVGLFAVAAAFIARLDDISLAAHQIAIMAISVVFMIPLGLASAAAVRVGQALGRNDPRGAAVSGWTAIALGTLFETGVVLLFLLAPVQIGRIFTHDEAIIRMAVKLLALAALFEMFDGFQGISTGALRGLGDTRTPMICHLIAYWVLGLPAGWYLCFRRGWGAPGFWVGFDVALIPLGLVLLAAWRRKSERPGGAANPGRSRFSAGMVE
jgi:multidrug resistance protein, MATE family